MSELAILSNVHNIFRSKHHFSFAKIPKDVIIVWEFPI